MHHIFRGDNQRLWTGTIRRFRDRETRVDSLHDLHDILRVGHMGYQVTTEQVDQTMDALAEVV
jgi:aspartate aminotransferase-like enzyme